MSGFKAKLHDAEGSIKKKYADQQLAGHGMGVKDRIRVARGENVRWEQTRASAQGSSEIGEDYSAGGAGVVHRLPPPPPGMPPPRSGAGGYSSPRPSPSPRGGPPARGGPPPLPPFRGGAAAPPPPAPRSGAAAPAPPGPKPRLPLRMNNEAGIDNPPPPYGAAPSASASPPALPTRSASQASSGSAAPAAGSHIEFSKFTQADKAQFFSLLDEYFASKGANVAPAY